MHIETYIPNPKKYVRIFIRNQCVLFHKEKKEKKQIIGILKNFPSLVSFFFYWKTSNALTEESKSIDKK